MERLTRTVEGENTYRIDGDASEAVRRLAMYENVHQQLLSRQEEVERELQKLRDQGKQKSGRFRELVARKLMHQSILDLFQEA